MRTYRKHGIRFAEFSGPNVEQGGRMWRRRQKEIEARAEGNAAYIRAAIERRRPNSFKREDVNYTE